ncbi:Alkylphosphonate ABC transporter, substrate-binding component [Mycoplasma yeatsii 13926]|uniref:Alkylphosphonate ABC transporter, substrate-binding component n=1 Tax=Mycoplasma yeatsii 13926 TaxID=1188240 RepID=S6G8L8_9MOLU|nr:alkylphosphonate ABC transporter substrate-binding protein [Mycoplasma yeatsii]EOA07534.1 Alkylphosphonate ABC transporter, substrate-binding component [Mycoplasma yeatsii 13926]
MKTNKLKMMLAMTGAVTAGSIVPFAVSCTKTSGWQEIITIKNAWVNEGFLKTDKEKQFLETLENKFESFKNQDDSLKNFKKVKFKIGVDGEKKGYLSKLEKDTEGDDVLITNYSYYLNGLFDPVKNEVKSDLPFQLVSQASTLRFTWQDNVNEMYSAKNGNKNDKIVADAVKNNQKWIDETGKEYPEWNTIEKSDKKPNGTLTFDGSKYTNFYEKDKLSYVYRGAILISGKKAEREKITQQWNSKDFDGFISNGIVYEKDSSAGSFKYQAALIARHFNKDLTEVTKILKGEVEKYKDHVFKGTSAAKQLGKETTAGSKKVIPKIGFDDEGAYNWTQSNPEKSKYQPKGFEKNKNVKDENYDNDVVRTLTFTNPAGYDVVLARKGLMTKQVELLSKALTSLTLDENTYGIYTGYNKFQNLTKEMFNNFIKLQAQAETTKDLVDEIPEAKVKSE